MTAMVWGKFFWNDWSGDQALRACSLAVRGLWMDMLCIAARHDPIGFVALNGRALGAADLARMAGTDEAEVMALLAELEANGVFSRDRRGRIYSRRMMREAKRSEEGRKHGRKGGNPSLCSESRKSLTLNPRDNPPLNREGSSQNPEARRQTRSEGVRTPSRQVPREVNGWVVEAVVARCLDILGVGDLRFPDIPIVVAELLGEGADPDLHIYVAMSSVARQGVAGVSSVKYLSVAVRKLMMRAVVNAVP
jgi:hypothetical protein